MRSTAATPAQGGSGSPSRAPLAGPDDPLPGVAADDVPRLRRTVDAAAAGGTPEEWAGLDESMAAEQHTAVVVRFTRVYPSSRRS